MNGPRGNYVYNTYWSKAIQDKIQKNRWKVITPSILLLASIAISERYKVDIIDEDFRDVRVNKHYDIVCIYTVTPTAKRAYGYAKEFSKKGAWILLGGVHATFMQEESMQYCDTLMIGEGDYIFRDFLHDFRKGIQKSIYVQERNQVDMAYSPIPAYHKLQKHEQHLVPIQTARGCSNNCKFCNVNGLYGNTFRHKSRKQIEQELSDVSNLPYAKRVYVTDDNIFSNERHFNRLIDTLKHHHLSWYANTDISFANDERDIISAYKSGLRQVLIGFESVEHHNLYHIDQDNFKYGYLKKYKEYIRKIQSNGIGVTGSFMVGQLHDNQDTFKYLAEFIYDTKLYGANITIVTPYPGTRLFHDMKRKNKILTYNWDYYTIFQPVMALNHLTIDKLNELYLELIMTVNSKAFEKNKLDYFKEIYKEKSKSR
ncbi:B12-binding domain-containing radical SAM protein [Vallitalea pronyensis]|uniref:B12-binding domain-containing radical SAM protein n=1 Tax=Vallitalea pronyensis TaxID=1348613 RepID=A0A8J8SFN2_9FIRM|nr:radical SAM protein [Vallitalea pronyensis]QUI21865.1 B12-binding domain-containing radical SAM protein [Vallitalea pronyensis]